MVAEARERALDHDRWGLVEQTGAVVGVHLLEDLVVGVLAHAGEEALLVEGFELLEDFEP